MKRRMFALTLAVLLALSAAGCGGGNQKALVGIREITDDAGSAYGWGIRFDQDGTFFFAAAPRAMTKSSRRPLRPCRSCTPSNIRSRAIRSWN